MEGTEEGEKQSIKSIVIQKKCRGNSVITEESEIYSIERGRKYKSEMMYWRDENMKLNEDLYYIEVFKLLKDPTKPPRVEIRNRLSKVPLSNITNTDPATCKKSSMTPISPHALCVAPTETTISNEPIRTIIFDLDLTLILSFPSQQQILNNNKNYRESADGTPFLIRPYALQTLKALKAGNYELLISTSSEQEYADQIIDVLEEGGRLFTDRFYRKDIYLHMGKNSYKKLPVHRHKRDILVVDDTFIYWVYSPANYVPIPPYAAEVNDTTLELLGNYFLEIKDLPDLRIINSTVSQIPRKLDRIKNKNYYLY